jgi:uncharacterized repeat protein (TIGR01451 family)
MKIVGTRASGKPSWLVPGFVLIVAMASLIGVGSSANAATGPVPLGTAANFAVLAGSTVTSTGPTTINGDLGLSPGTSVTGFPPGQVNGTIHAADSLAAQAQADLTSAYDDAAARPVTATVPVELGGTTETPGTYNSAAGTFGITGTLTLDAQGNPDAVFIFQAASTLITAAASNVNLVNGAQASNVFWVVGSSATLGTNSALQGNVLALTSITVTTGTTIDGRALAINGAVTLDTNTITAPNPAPSPSPSSSPSSSPSPALTITKTADIRRAAPDDTVHYTITVTDTGPTAYAGATLTDSLSGVLGDAAYNDDATATAGAVSFTSPDLTWTGDLATGATVTVTYSVTVNHSITGNLNLANTVSSDTPGSNCPPGNSDPQCSVTVAVVTGMLSITAPSSADLGTAAPGRTASARLGTVQVTDGRAGLAGWTATVSSTDFTTGGGKAAETIPADDILYAISGFASTTGSATLTHTPGTNLSAGLQAVAQATNVHGDNSATWSPLIQVAVPSGAVAGTYSAIITHSVY